MAKMPTVSTPKGPKMPTLKAPRAELDALPVARKPLPTAGGRDIISITTRMRETPAVKGNKK